MYMSKLPIPTVQVQFANILLHPPRNINYNLNASLIRYRCMNSVNELTIVYSTVDCIEKDDDGYVPQMRGLKITEESRKGPRCLCH
jgi:hypothetical protein